MQSIGVNTQRHAIESVCRGNQRAPSGAVRVLVHVVSTASQAVPRTRLLSPAQLVKVSVVPHCTVLASGALRVHCGTGGTDRRGVEGGRGVFSGVRAHHAWFIGPIHVGVHKSSRGAQLNLRVHAVRAAVADEGDSREQSLQQCNQGGAWLAHTPPHYRRRWGRVTLTAGACMRPHARPSG